MTLDHLGDGAPPPRPGGRCGARVSEQQGRCWPRSSRRPSPIWNSVRRNGRGRELVARHLRALPAGAQGGPGHTDGRTRVKSRPASRLRSLSTWASIEALGTRMTARSSLRPLSGSDVLPSLGQPESSARAEGQSRVLRSTSRHASLPMAAHPRAGQSPQTAFE